MSHKLVQIFSTKFFKILLFKYVNFYFNSEKLRKKKRVPTNFHNKFEFIGKL